jgi:hypothetical protein
LGKRGDNIPNEIEARRRRDAPFEYLIKAGFQRL